MEKFDAIIIGSGQAGTPLVFKMVSLGKKVAFIEKNIVGGTCLNVGCTPTKTYVASARRIWEAQHGDELGIEIPSGATAILKKIKARKDQLIQGSVNGIGSALEANDLITFIHGSAEFIGHKEIKVNDRILTADQIFINVGGRTYVPPGYEAVPYLTNESILKLEELPEHLIIVGGSYIGLEFGQIFRRFGSQVTIVEKGSRIIGREDEEVSQAINEVLEAEGIEFRLNATCLSAKQEENGTITVQIDCSTGKLPSINGTHLLLGVGRRPNTDSLMVEKTGLKINQRGYIEVDDTLETNVPGIYALGDCNGKGAFTHTAYNDYEIVADNLFENKDRKVNDRILTYGLFVDPPLGRVGLTKKMALDQGYEVLEGRREMKNIARAREKGETAGFISVLIDKKTKKILGASILGIGGDEIISSITNIMYTGCSYEIMKDAVIAHPTVSELIPTLLENLNEIK